MKYYDREKKCLVDVGKKVSSDYWDEHWRTEDVRSAVLAGTRNRLIREITDKFLSPPAKILDGGCGIGQNVYGLKQWGYDSYGVDYADKTIAKVSAAFPELKIRFGDVRRTGYDSSFFNGYWSLGVIEHFWEGYSEVVSEARRIIKTGGYLFVTIPYLSWFRRFKIFIGAYEICADKNKPDDFYQYILDEMKVRTEIEKLGFRFVMKRPYGAVKGIKDECKLLAPILQKVYDGMGIIAGIFRKLLSLMFDRVAGHMILMVFKKE